MSDYLKGIIFTTLGVIILSPDSLLMRLLYAETWTVVFWRGISLAVGIAILMLLIYRGKTLHQFRKIGKWGVIIGIVFGTSTIFFTSAIQNTSIANTLVIISTSPMFSALLSWFFLKEKVLLRTWIAMFVILAAIIAIMSHSAQEGAIFGDICALFSSICMAISFTLMRQFKEVNMVPAMAIGGIFAVIFSATMIATMGGTYLITAEAIPYLIMAGFVVTIAFALITLGPRYIPAPEVGLIMPLEIVLGSYLGWIFLSEKPSLLTIIGGVLVILTLIVHSWLALRENKQHT